jgi:hypothetical protein
MRIMTKSNSTPKRKRIPLPPIASATRRILKKKPDGVASWSDRLVEKLLTLATNPKTPAATAMQAIRILIEHSGNRLQADDAADFSHESDGPSLAQLRSKSKDELDRYIADLMTTIGSIPGVKPETPAAE